MEKTKEPVLALAEGHGSEVRRVQEINLYHNGTQINLREI